MPSPQETSDTIEYRKIIQRLAAGGINQRIPNGKPAHAAILLEAMFDKACTHMRIFTGALLADTYDSPELIEAASRFVKRGGRVRILIQDRFSPSELEGRPLVSAIKGGLDTRFAEGSYAKKDAKHMAIMDDRGYRFETDHKNTSAVANFNEPRVALELMAAFDTAFNMGTATGIGG